MNGIDDAMKILERRIARMRENRKKSLTFRKRVKELDDTTEELKIALPIINDYVENG
jgi:hypothetical protein